MILTDRTGRSGCTALSESYAISVGFNDVLLVPWELDGPPGSWGALKSQFTQLLAAGGALGQSGWRRFATWAGGVVKCAASVFEGAAPVRPARRDQETYTLPPRGPW